MKTRAAVAWKAGAPLTIETIDIGGPKPGEVLVEVHATEQAPRRTVFCSVSVSNVPVNALTGSGYDPITDTAELKVCAVRIEPANGDLG